jgi:hypothetical protein
MIMPYKDIYEIERYSNAKESAIKRRKITCATSS